LQLSPIGKTNTRQKVKQNRQQPWGKAVSPNKETK